jgi:hypothetical protein
MVFLAFFLGDLPHWAVRTLLLLVGEFKEKKGWGFPH